MRRGLWVSSVVVLAVACSGDEFVPSPAAPSGQAGATTSAGGSAGNLAGGTDGGATSGGSGQAPSGASGAAGAPGGAGGGGAGVSGSGGTAAAAGGNAGALGGAAGGSACAPEVCGNGVDDDCDGVVDEDCACGHETAIPGYKEGDGLRALPSAGFGLVDTNEWQANAQRIASWNLPKVGVAGLSLTQKGAAQSVTFTPTKASFRWDVTDAQIAHWGVQGVTGGAVSGKEWLAVSWRYDACRNLSDTPRTDGGGDKGVRISFVDVSSANAFPYEQVLLVEPTIGSFQEVIAGAGGIAWAGNYLYVTDATRGLRVFDLTEIRTVSPAGTCAGAVGKYLGEYCALGHRYVLPQIGAYTMATQLPADCRLAFSVLASDVASSTPSLFSAESQADGIYGRLVRWPLDAATSRLVTDGTGTAHATEALYLGQESAQGVAHRDGAYWINSSRQCGTLYTGAANKPTKAFRSADGKWGALPQGAYLAKNGNLWTATEGRFDRPCNAAVCGADACAQSTCGDSPRLVYAASPAP